MKRNSVLSQPTRNCVQTVVNNNSKTTIYVLLFCAFSAVCYEIYKKSSSVSTCFENKTLKLDQLKVIVIYF